MRSDNLEQSVCRAVGLASERRHEYTTLEHLLLSLTEDQDAVPVLRACNVDLERLRKDLTEFIDGKLGDLVSVVPGDPKQSPGFEHVLQLAARRVRSSDEATGAHVLVALLSGRESPSLHFLQRQEMTTRDALDYISHGIVKLPGQGQSERIHSADLIRTTGEAEPPRRTPRESMSVIHIGERKARIVESPAPVQPSSNLKESIQRALGLASARHHAYATQEHFLLSLTEDQDAASLLRACNVDLERLGRELTEYLNSVQGDLSDVVTTTPGNPKPEAGLVVSMLVLRAMSQRQRRSAGPEEVTGADVVIALLSERGDSPVTYVSQLQDMHRLDALNYISNDIAMRPRA